MSWKAYRLPIFAIVGFLAPPLLVWGWKSIPREWLTITDGPPKLERAPDLNEPITFAARGPVTGFDPFRKILKSPTKPVIFAAPPVQAPTQHQLTQTQAAPNVVVQPVEASPEPRLEGVVGGEDPVAVLKFGEESRFVREGDKIVGGLEVISITDGEVRLKRGSSEIVLKTGV
jgi:hypothetical protein